MNYEELLERLECYIKDSTDLGTTLFSKDNKSTESILVDLIKVSKYIDKYFCRNTVFVVLCKVGEPEVSGKSVDAQNIYEKIKPNFCQYYIANVYIGISFGTIFFDKNGLYLDIHDDEY